MVDELPTELIPEALVLGVIAAIPDTGLENPTPVEELINGWGQHGSREMVPRSASDVASWRLRLMVILLCIHELDVLMDNLC